MRLVTRIAAALVAFRLFWYGFAEITSGYLWPMAGAVLLYGLAHHLTRSSET